MYVNPISLGGENSEKIASFMDGLDTVFSESIVTKGKTIQSSSFTIKISELETRLGEQTKAINTVTDKSEKNAIVQAGIGKLSFTEENLVSNIKEFISSINKSKPDSVKGKFINKVYLSTSMGPSIRIENIK